jgi:cytochrome c peroxidase
MKICLRGAGVLSLGLFALALVLAGSGSAASQAGDAEASPAVKPSTARTLRLPETPYRYADLDLPAHFLTPAARRFDNAPSDNPVTDTGATLGRVLFYDTRLSANNTVACATCHLQKHAFVDGLRVSKGFSGKLTDRNSMTLVNLRYYPRGRFFWDERAATLEDQVLLPIQSKVEMGHDLARVVEMLAGDKHYQELFHKAFGDRTVTRDRISRALAQFVRSLVSYRSKYDEGLAKVQSVRADFPNFTTAENRGKAIFLARCATCHMPGGQAAHFIMVRPRNNGLDATVGGDGGVGDVTLRGREVGLFKSPSLRNIEFTGPYMHDGRFATLEQVVDHYSQGIKAHPNLDGRLRRRRALNAGQKAALVAFLKTLSDRAFLADPKYSDPFQ